MVLQSTLGTTQSSGKTISSRLSASTAVILVVLLVAFYVVAVNNMMAIGNQVDAIKRGPYAVSVAAGRVETLLVQSQTIAERVTYVRDGDAVDDVERSFAALDVDMRKKVGFIVDNDYLDVETSQALARGYDDLAAKQEELLALCRDASVSDEQIDLFVANELNPLTSDLLSRDVDILDQATASVEELYETVTSLGSQTVAFASVLMAAVLVSLFVYLSLLHRKSQQQKLLRENLEQALDLAQKASAAKSRFLSTMSHDIRTPMNAVVGLTSIAGNHRDDPQRVGECLNLIDGSCQHLLSLINDVLDMGEIESGKITLNEARFCLPDLLDGVAAIMQPQARMKNQRFDVRAGRISRECLVGDFARLSQALVNIVGNAVKYTPEGGSVLFSVSEEPVEHEEPWIYRFVVQDTGAGMSPEFLDKLFEPFEREDGPATSGVEGTGLGMAITKSIVDLMGGTIRVESAPGEGTTFEVAVPLAPASDGGDETDLSELRDGLVLEIGGNADQLETLRSMLDSAGLRGLAVAPGAAALQAIDDARQGGGFCAVVVDATGPQADALAVVRDVRSRFDADIPVIMLMPCGVSSIDDDSRAAGATTALALPLFESRVRKALKTWCGSSDDSHAADSGSACVEGRVLLVEDDNLNRDIAKELIGYLGPDVDAARDGQEAVEKVLEADEGRYQLVFMDMRMPRMDGVGATKALRKASLETGRPIPPIIAMTANAFNEDREEALAAGMDDFMTKPIDLKELERILRKYLS